MQEILDVVAEELRSFIAQRTDVALLLRCNASDTLPILTVLESVEAESAADLFWIMPDAFHDSESYAEAITDAFFTRQEAVRLSLEEEGAVAWPPNPRTSGEERPGTPADRLRQACTFSREMLPDPAIGASVWVLNPLELHDGPAFCALMAELIRHELPRPWCQRLRFVICVGPDDPGAALLQSQPRVRSFTPDFGPDAVERHLSATAEDDTLALDERMGTLMVMAGVDQALHRHADAREKYALLHRFHDATGSGVAAVALGGVAEAAEAMGDLAGAGDAYERALALAGQETHLPVPLYLNLTMGIGRLRLKEDRCAEGEAWFEMAQQLAILARNAPMRIQALELRGVCQHAQHRYELAEQSWIGGSVLAAQLEDVPACRGLVLRLARHYRETGQVEAARERRDQLVDLGHAGPI
ncbi:tetratricopeptide repeat protein [Plastoroseomonas arctica]|uniref:MalT-like TPR region domain-containing protein n=1 Tax=Plastoroseomonas arctica TaxID=1509237 RepID=A0AAF1JWR0_9PROT|nr:hypothetical protein [Plastoroseomonas arctica]MBR0655531.1 hypothetical protein [Plastoroseomonas arctica]